MWFSFIISVNLKGHNLTSLQISVERLFWKQNVNIFTLIFTYPSYLLLRKGPKFPKKSTYSQGEKLIRIMLLVKWVYFHTCGEMEQLWLFWVALFFTEKCNTPFAMSKIWFVWFFLKQKQNFQTWLLKANACHVVIWKYQDVSLLYAEGISSTDNLITIDYLKKEELSSLC